MSLSAGQNPVHDVVREDIVLYTSLSGKTESCTRRCQVRQSPVHVVVR